MPSEKTTQYYLCKVTDKLLVPKNILNSYYGIIWHASNCVTLNNYQRQGKC